MTRFFDLLERDGERSVTIAAIERVLHGEGKAVAFESPAGLGKSSLLSAAMAEARERGARLLPARAVELEHDLAYGAIRQMVLPELARRSEAERASLLGGPASLAAVALGFPAQQPPGDPAGAALHGLYWLIVNMAEDCPLVLALDDAHWADQASLRFLAYLNRRLEGVPVLVLVAARTAEPGVDRTLIELLLRDPSVDALRPLPLSQEATAVLVRARLGAPVSVEICNACHATTGGNPFLLGELLEALKSEGIDAAELSPSRIAGIGPQAVARSVLIRLARLPSAALEVARAAAIFPEGAELRHVAALAGIGYEEASRALDQLAEVAVLAPRRPVSFLHPVMRSAVYEDLPPGARAVLHLRAARLLRAESAPLSAVCSHLFACEPGMDGEAFGELMAAAGGAVAAGAPHAAIRYLDRALQEPVPRAAVANALHLRGVARMLAGDARAVHDLQSAADAADPACRAAVLRDLGRVLAFSFQTQAAVDALDQAIAAQGGGNPDLLARCIADRTWILWSHEHLGHRFIAEMQDATVKEEPNCFLDRALAAYKAFWEAWHCGDAGDVVAMATRALREPLLASEGFDGLPPVALGAIALALVDRPDDGLAALDESLAVLRATGTAMGLTYGHFMAGMIRLYAGDLREAESDLQVGLELTLSQHGGAEGEAAIRTLAAVVALERAQPQEAAALLDGLPDPPTWLGLLLHAARGRIHFAAGRFDAALEDFDAVLRAAPTNGLRNPLYPFPWHAEFALSACAMGDGGRVRAIVDESLVVARRFGARGVLGAALRVGGLVRTGDERLALLHQAVATLERSSARLLYAQAQADLGTALRRANRRSEAREPLRVALDVARRCGADRLAAAAREELLVTGARPRRELRTGAASLTPAERRVARMAASGLTNRQIAQQLFLTVRTVEMHVSNALSKLGVSSRRDLPDALDGDRSPSGQDV